MLDGFQSNQGHWGNVSALNCLFSTYHEVSEVSTTFEVTLDTTSIITFVHLTVSKRQRYIVHINKQIKAKFFRSKDLLCAINDCMGTRNIRTFLRQ